MPYLTREIGAGRNRRSSQRTTLNIDVFVSHASEDAEWARKLSAALKRSGVNAWDASSHLSPGDNWSLETGKALEKAAAMIVLLSPAATRSESVKREIEYALTSKRFDERLIPVLVKPTTGFPWVLSQIQFEQGQPGEVAKRVARRLKFAQTVSAN